jgi:hypothetical protein
MFYKFFSSLLLFGLGHAIVEKSPEDGGYSTIFTNVCASRDNIHIMGKYKINGLLAYACGAMNLSSGTSFVSIGDTAGLAYCGDDTTLSEPQ